MLLVVNFKNYRIDFQDTIRFAQKAAEISDRYGVPIALAPPHFALSSMLVTAYFPSSVYDMTTQEIVESGDAPMAGDNLFMLAQHVDTNPPGSSTGFVVPELLSDIGIQGSIINHTEHPVEPSQIAHLIPRLQNLTMMSIVCARDARECGEYAKLDPTFVAVEPPELIGTGKSVSTYEPDLIKDAAAAVRDAGTSTRLLCGAGITSGDDVVKAMSLGSSGVLVASGVVTTPDPAAALEDLASAMIPRRVD